jgi:uncharacterized protein YndB with AHSA1/START domain
MSKRNKADFKMAFTVPMTADKVFDAINNVRGWWIGNIEGTTDKVGAKFVYKYKYAHDTTQEILELVPNKKIVWKVIKSDIYFVKNKKEWLGTKIIFKLIAIKDATEIHFTHEGLNPSLQCHDGCAEGWNFYLGKSLKNWILKGEGVAPNF